MHEITVMRPLIFGTLSDQSCDMCGHTIYQGDQSAYKLTVRTEKGKLLEVYVHSPCLVTSGFGHNHLYKPSKTS